MRYCLDPSQSDCGKCRRVDACLYIYHSDPEMIAEKYHDYMAKLIEPYRREWNEIHSC